MLEVPDPISRRLVVKQLCCRCSLMLPLWLWAPISSGTHQVGKACSGLRCLCTEQRIVFKALSPDVSRFPCCVQRMWTQNMRKKSR